MSGSPPASTPDAVRPVWDDTASPGDLRALGPGPDALDPRPDVLVVGGGVAGLAAAALCVRSGLGRVCLVERGRLAGGASGSAAGGLSPDTHAMSRPEFFLSLARRSLELHRELDAEWGVGVRELDWVVALPGVPSPELRWAPATEAVDAEAAHAAEPQLGDVAGALVIRRQAHVHPLRLAAALSARAGSVATGVEVVGVDCPSGRLVRVRTTRGDVSPGAVVLATGTARGLPGLDLPAVPDASVKGHLLATEPAPFALMAGVASTILVVQTGDGRLVAGGTFDAGDSSPAPDGSVLQAIREEMARLVPGAASLRVTHGWCCFRPGVPDELPLIDRVPGLENAWVSAAHHRTGLLVAPAAGEAIASWIASGRRPAGADGFGFGRLVTS